MRRTNWFDRTFPVIQDNGLLPGIIERLEGTPARLTEKVKSLNDNSNPASQGGNWSIKKEIGHLADLEPLWYERLHQVIDDNPNMKEADLTNRKTHETPHDDKTFDQLIAEFKTERQKFIAELRMLKESDLDKTSLHPRLKTPMKVIDLAYFVAEHDDHHLAQMTRLMCASQS
ncbi:MAG: DinB family protein [Sphingobacteriales bacterium]